MGFYTLLDEHLDTPFDTQILGARDLARRVAFVEIPEPQTLFWMISGLVAGLQAQQGTEPASQGEPDDVQPTDGLLGRRAAG